MELYTDTNVCEQHTYGGEVKFYSACELKVKVIAPIGSLVYFIRFHTFSVQPHFQSCKGANLQI